MFTPTIRATTTLSIASLMTKDLLVSVAAFFGRTKPESKNPSRIQNMSMSKGATLGVSGLERRLARVDADVVSIGLRSAPHCKRGHA